MHTNQIGYTVRGGPTYICHFVIWVRANAEYQNAERRSHQREWNEHSTHYVYIYIYVYMMFCACRDSWSEAQIGNRKPFVQTVDRYQK